MNFSCKCGFLWGIIIIDVFDKKEEKIDDFVGSEIRLVILFCFIMRI